MDSTVKKHKKRVRIAEEPHSEETIPLVSPFAEEPQPLRVRGGLFRDKFGRYRTLYDQRARTTVLVNVAGILERSNEQTLPALYKYVGASFKATPRQLGFITLACALVQALCSPIGGILGHFYNRVNILGWGCLIWGSMSLAFSLSSSMAQGLFFWALNGVGLALLIPNAQSLIADYFSEYSRGRAFGFLYLTAAIGGMLGALGATNLGHLRPWGLIEGWRVAFMIVALISLIVGILNMAYSVDPRINVEEERYRQDPDILKEGGPTLSRIIADITSIFAVPTFLIIITQGVIGSAPWNALVFNTYYLQLLGFSDFHASLVAALFLLGTALGAMIGGSLGDWAARIAPNHGRILVAQLSVAIGVPSSIFVYKGLSGGVATFGVVFFVWGSLISWAGSACTSPMFAEIVPSQQRPMIYSFDRALEGAIAAMGAPLVGWLAERMGFSESQEQSDEQKAQALATALALCTAAPWAVCCIFFTGLHLTYPRDKASARLHQRARSGLPIAELLPQMTVGEALSTGLLSPEVTDGRRVFSG